MGPFERRLTVTVKGEEIWRALERDDGLMSRLPTERHRSAVREYVVEEMVDGIRHMLDRTASLGTILETQIAYARHSFGSEMPLRLMAADMGMDDDDIPEFFREIAAGILEFNISQIEPIAKDAERHLKESGRDETGELIDIGFTPATASLIVSRLLTIADVLRKQPAVIIDPGRDTAQG